MPERAHGQGKVSPHRDDSFSFSAAHESFRVSLTDAGFDAPFGLTARGQTAVLALTVDARGPGKVRPPFVEVEAGGSSHRQYFERAASGRRYLNLSPIFQRGRPGGAITRVGLRGDAISWRSDGILALFEPPPLVGARILVLAPHPDDAEIAAFGLYAQRSPSPWIVTLTAGEKGASEISALIPPDEDPDYWKAHLRVWDSLAVPQLGGVDADRCVNLAFPDGELANMQREPTRTFRLRCEDRLPRSSLRARNRCARFREPIPDCTWAGLVADLRSVLEEARPNVIVCPHPLVDGHGDHRFTTIALEEALGAGGGGADAAILFYVVHVRGWGRYPFGPPESVVSLPPWQEEAWTADALYSHPLSASMQRGKYFAVEATHDSHPFGTAVTSLRRFTRDAAQGVSALAGTLAHRSASFLRRAPRPNELFYLASRRSLSELVGRVRADAGARLPSSRLETTDHSSRSVGR